MADSAPSRLGRDRDDGYVLAYRNHLIACWFASVADLPGEMIERYAEEIAAADRSTPGHGDVVAKLRRDLNFRAIQIPSEAIEAAVREATGNAWRHHGMTD